VSQATVTLLLLFLNPMKEYLVGDQALSAIDLFCGAGGLSAGFAQEGYEVALGIDFDQAAVETYALNFGSDRAEHADLLEFTASDVRKRVGGDIDVILGGPSCQPFSTHGRAQGWVVGDPRSDLWSRMHSYVAELRPKAFLMENVPGMLYFSGGTFVDSLSDAFRELGYTLCHQILLAADYNVPQLRRRLIVVGILGDSPFEFPSSPRLGGWRRDSLEKWEAERIKRDLLPHVTLREALAGLSEAAEPGVPARYSSTSPSGPYDAYMRASWSGRRRRSRPEFVFDHERVPVIPEVRDLVGYVPPGGTWRDIPPHLLPERFRSMRRTDSTNLYGRMTWDRPAYTMTTQFQNITTGCFIHPDEDRPLTVREGARVQTFSDDFRFTGSTAANVRLIGNAVPPLLARALARQLAAQLSGEDVSGREAEAFGPTRYRGKPVPGGREAAEAMKSSGRHDDAARRVLAQHLGTVVPGLAESHTVEEASVAVDLAVPSEKVAIFVQGCFIYGCPTCSRGTKSQTWWGSDISRRVEERELEIERLDAAGWRTITVWEHESPDAVVKRVQVGLAAA
jgi:DNA (cytosine-5)-methyltransferase 1